jgi:hypothetical protein
MNNIAGFDPTRRIDGMNVKGCGIFAGGLPTMRVPLRQLKNF